MTTDKDDVCEVEEKTEASREDKKETWDDRMVRRLGLAALLFVGFFALGLVMSEYRMKESGWAFFLAFASIPAAFTGLVERCWRTYIERFKRDIDFRRLVYGLVVITYLGCWAVYLVGTTSTQTPQPVKFDVNLTTPSYAPIRIDAKHTHNGNRTY